MRTNSWRSVISVGLAITAATVVIAAECASRHVAAQSGAPEEMPKEIIVDQIRRQGFTCTRAVTAERDRERSKPHEAVWLLKCENATYRVRLIPDMAAVVERLD